MEKRQAIEFLEYLRQDRNLEKTIYGDALNIAIGALKAQLSKQGTTSDLISRQAAIDAVDAIGHIATMPDGDKCIRRSAVKYTLSMLPPAQPEPQEGHWIWVAGELMCSECRTIYSDLYPDYDNAVACPHCGAKMTTSTK